MHNSIFTMYTFMQQIKPCSLKEGLVFFISCWVYQVEHWLPAFLAKVSLLQNYFHSFVLRPDWGGHLPWCRACKAEGSCVITAACLCSRGSGSGNCPECRHHTTFQDAWHAQVYVCLWYAVVVYYVEEMESLPVHITNASLTNDISSKLEFSF